MKQVFFTVLGMSGTGALVILAVLLARLALRKAPKIFSYALWGVALLRLLCPFSLESAFGLLPAVEVRPQETAQSAPVEVDLGRGRVTVTVDNTIEFPLTRELEPDAAASIAPASVPPGKEGIAPADPAPGAPEAVELRACLTWWAALALVWLAGACLLLGYGGISLLRLRRRLVGAVPLAGEEGVWLADHIPSPFVLGVIRPRIYLPSGLPEGERDYILLHERTHIRRLDHVTRALAWLALCIHWFNPLVWLAFHLAGKDMELSCDEAVLGKMGRDIRADYSTSLLRLSAGGRLPVGPLAFGDGDPRSRIENILRWKKPALWVMAAGLLLVLTACTALATTRGPAADSPEPPPFAYHEPGPAEIWVDSVIIEGMAWDEYREIQLGEYPGVTFRLYPGKLTAVRDGDEVTLFDGMPIENAYLCDLDGDGGREICSQVCIGSGIGDERIRVIRWCESGSFSLLELEDRMTHDYYLGQVGDQLTVEERDYVSGARTRYGRLILTEDGLDIKAQGGGLDLPSADLSLTIEGDVVRIKGGVGNVALSRTTWFPPDGEQYPLGRLWMEYPLLEEEGWKTVDAVWTDGSRSAVTVTTTPGAMISSYSNPGNLVFTVDLAERKVLSKEGHIPKMSPNDPERTITDQRAVETARAAARLLTAAEECWNGRKGTLDTKLAFTLDTAGEEHTVRMDGSVGDVELKRGAFWYPASWPASGQDYPYGYLSMMYPGFTDGIEGLVNARWTDGSRRSVTVDTEMMAMLSSYAPSGWWEFTVDLDSGDVTRMEGKSFREGRPDGETRFYPASISDGEAVKAARVAAKLLTAGEDYWNNATGAASPSPAPDAPALDGLTFSQGWYDAINIEGLDAKGVSWYPPGEEFPQGQLAFENPAFLGPAFTGRHIYGGIAWTDDKHTAMPMKGYLSVDQVSVDLAIWPDKGQVVRDQVDIGITDSELIAMAETCARIMEKAAEYKAAQDSLPPEEGIMPFGRPLELEFAGGAGAWSTQLRIYPDGSFVGDYSDTDAGVSGEGYYGTVYVCPFHGRFRDVTQVTDASWSLTLDELVLDTGRPVGEKWIEEGVQYISSTPYGFTRVENRWSDDAYSVTLEPGAQFMLYSPEARGYAPGDELYGMSYNEEGDYDSILGQFWTWQPWGSRVGVWGRDTTLGRWGLCNMETGYGFFSR